VARRQVIPIARQSHAGFLVQLGQPGIPVAVAPYAVVLVDEDKKGREKDESDRAKRQDALPDSPPERDGGQDKGRQAHIGEAVPRRGVRVAQTRELGDAGAVDGGGVYGRGERGRRRDSRRRRFQIFGGRCVALSEGG